MTQRPEISIKQLAQERWILFERGSSIRRATDDFFKRMNIEPETALESNDTYFIKIMIEHGLGISLLPSWAVRDEIERGKLVLVKVKQLKLRRTVAILSMKGQQSAPIRAFINYVTEKKADLQKIARLITHAPDSAATTEPDVKEDVRVEEKIAPEEKPRS